ncbi:MAG: diguanylate cyclase [Lachnospiraceae bacterium]|nr:diguanylate cyclase [Lachnospiraceae bacterium]
MRKNAYNMLIILVVLTLLLIPLFSLPVRSVSRNLTFFDSDYTIRFRDKTYTHVTPSDLASSGITDIRRGDTLDVLFSLPSDFSYAWPALLIRTRYASLRVTLDGEEIFSHDSEEESSFLSYLEWGSHYIDLPPDYTEKQLTVSLTATTENPFLGIFPVIFGPHDLLLTYTTYLGLLPLFVALFIAAYAIFYIILSLIFMMRGTDISGQIFAAMLCLLCGIWLLSHHEFFSLLLPDGHSLLLEYVMQFLAVPFFFLYLRRVHPPLRSRFYGILATTAVIISIVAITLEITLDLRKNFPTYLYLMFLLLGAFMIGRFFYDVYHDPDVEPSEIIQISGLALLTLSIFMHVVFYFIKDMRGIERSVMGRCSITFGVALFLESQLINYFVFVTRRFAERIERTELEEMAYRDFLTNLPNRTDAERVFSEMTNTADDFCVVMFDLNELKEVNDKSGHDAGDRLLSEFAHALGVAFDEGTYLARIGGDEFVAILEGVTPHKVERHLRDLDNALKRLDIMEPDIAHSAAYGYAFRHECAEDESEKRKPVSPFQMIHGPADFSDVDYNFTMNRRRMNDRKEVVKQENVESSESRFPVGSDILQRVLTLADQRMYEKKRLFRLESGKKEPEQETDRKKKKAK